MPCCAVCRCADYVLLNKTDLLPPGQLASLQAVVASINPLATVCCRSINAGIRQTCRTANCEDCPGSRQCCLESVASGRRCPMRELLSFPRCCSCR